MADVDFSILIKLRSFKTLSVHIVPRSGICQSVLIHIDLFILSPGLLTFVVFQLGRAPVEKKSFFIAMTLPMVFSLQKREYFSLFLFLDHLWPLEMLLKLPLKAKAFHLLAFSLSVQEKKNLWESFWSSAWTWLCHTLFIKLLQKCLVILLHNRHHLNWVAYIELMHCSV